MPSTVEVHTNNSISRSEISRRQLQNTTVISFAVSRSLENEYKIYRFFGSAVYNNARGCTMGLRPVEHELFTKRVEVLTACRELAKTEHLEKKYITDNLLVFVTFEYSEATIDRALDRQDSLVFEKKLKEIEVSVED